jgi:murein DD-endopeptidase MepM/ murein hydrolase activator NlpD
MSQEQPDFGSFEWHWPVPDLLTAQGARFPAIVSHEYEGRKHPGVDVMYRRAAVSDFPSIPAGQREPNGMANADASGRFFAPRGTPVLAARDAVVWSIAKTVNGIFIVLDHGKPWATMYGHLETVDAGRGAAVKAGQRIGTMGAGLNTDPRKGLVDGQHLRHLHFEAWYKGANSAHVDPERAMSKWKRSVWTP